MKNTSRVTCYNLLSTEMMGIKVLLTKCDKCTMTIHTIILVSPACCTLQLSAGLQCEESCSGCSTAAVTETQGDDDKVSNAT